MRLRCPGPTQPRQGIPDLAPLRRARPSARACGQGAVPGYSKILNAILNHMNAGARMRRRDFLSVLGGATAGWPFVARAQTLPLIGYIHALSATSGASTTAAFRRGLSETGF